MLIRLETEMKFLEDAATHGHLGLHEDQCIVYLSFNVVKQRQGATEKQIKIVCPIWSVRNYHKDTHVRYAIDICDMRICTRVKQTTNSNTITFK